MRTPSDYGITCSRPSQSVLCEFPKSDDYHGDYEPRGVMAAEAKRQRVHLIHPGGLEIFTADDVAELHRRRKRKAKAESKKPRTRSA